MAIGAPSQNASQKERPLELIKDDMLGNPSSIATPGEAKVDAARAAFKVENTLSCDEHDLARPEKKKHCMSPAAIATSPS